MMWFVKFAFMFGSGCISAWILLSPSFWKWVWRHIKHLFVGEIPQKRYVKPKPPEEKIQDLSKLSKEELTELLKNSDVRVARK
jgi:hypothetical protein